MSISPSTVTTLVATPATISGAELFNSIRVDLDSDDEPSVSTAWQVRIGAIEVDPNSVNRLDQTQLVLEIPAGIEPGVHDVVVTSPSGATIPVPGGLEVVAGPLGLAVTIEDSPAGTGVAVDARLLAAGDDLALYAIARDADGDFVAEVEADWVVDGVIGSLSQSAAVTTTSFQAELVGTGRVTATPSVGDAATTGDLVVEAGPAASVTIRDQAGGAGMAVGDRSTTTDDTLEVFAAGYDAFGNYAGDVDATWSVGGAIGTAPAGPAVSTTIDFTTPGVGTLVASTALAPASTGDLTVAPGQAFSIALQGMPLSISADDSPLTLSFIATDADGNVTTDAGTVSWSIESGPITALDVATGELDPMAAGSGTVRVTSSYGPTDDGSVTVTAGVAADLTVSPMTAVVSADDIAPAIDFDVTATDGDGNPTTDLGTIVWSVAAGPITAIDPATGELDPVAAGVGQVMAVSSHGASGMSGDIEITPGAVATLTVVPETLVAYENGPGTIFTATGIDSDGNPTTDLGTLTWSIASGPITAIAADGTFTPLTPGSGQVQAVSSHGPGDVGGIVTVLQEAQLAAAITPSPTTVNTDQSFTVSMQVDNLGESDAAAVAPSALAQTGTTTASLIAGPTPPSAAIAAGSFATFTWTYSSANPGTVDFTGSASGTDVNTSNVVTSPGATSPAVTVQLPAVLAATVSIPQTITLGSTFTVDVLIDNSGQASATGVAPSITAVMGTGSASFVSGPSPASAIIAGGGSQLFSYNYSADAIGTIEFSADAAGTDANDSSAVTAPASASNTGTIIDAGATLVASDPFGDGTPSSYVVGYNNSILLGPSSDGTSAVSFADGDGNGAQSYSFSIFEDTGSGASHDNNAGGPYPSLGSTGCTQDTLACGPDNEDGRGTFAVATIAGTEWLVAGSGRSGGDLDYVYMSVDLDATLDFSFVDLSDALGGSTRGFSAAHSFNDRLYLGFPDSGGSRPYFLSLITTPGQPGLDANKDVDVLDLQGSDIGGLDDTSPARIDVIADFNDRLYAANAGAWVRSNTNTPVDNESFLVITPSATSYTSKISVAPVLNADIEPADRAVPSMVEFGGHLFAARNTTAGPQIWFCDPSPGTHCDSTDWDLAAANSVGDTALSQFNNPSNAAIAFIAASPSYLYVGFDNADGIVVFRTTVASPTLRSDWLGDADCDASNHPSTCDGISGAGFGDATNTRIFDAETITAGGTTRVYVVVGDGVTGLELYQLID